MTHGTPTIPESPAVVDEVGHVIRLTRALSRGTEGEVFLTADPELVVKLTRGSGDAARRRLERVRRLPLEDLPVVRPEALLRDANFAGEPAIRLERVTGLARPAAGYVMRYRGDLRPLLELTVPGTPTAAWWSTTGGTESRLRELGRLAAAIGALHRRGIVVGDVSPLNLLGGRPESGRPVALIDPDGLRHASDAPEIVLFTPPYVAPEVFTGAAPTTAASDVFAFAAIACHALTLIQPFFGDRVSDGPVEAEEEALTGVLPWILDKDDESNRARAALPADQVMTPRLLELLQRCFGPGRGRPCARPSAAALAGTLLDAADRCALCPGCGETGLGARCLLCDAPFAVGHELTTVSTVDMDAPPDAPEHVLTVWEGRERPLERRVLGVRASEGHRVAAWVRGDGGLTRLRASEDCELDAPGGVVPGGGTWALTAGQPVRLRGRDGTVVLRVREASA